MNNKKYKCCRCFFESSRKSIILNHINKKNICKKNIYCYFIQSDILEQASLLIENNHKNDFYCIKCNKNFSTKYNLERHNNSCNDKNKDLIYIYIKYKLPNIYSIHQVIHYFSQRSMNEYFKKNKIIQSFYKNWNLTHIDLLSKKLLFISNDQFSDLLIKILENEKNMNALFDKNEEYGYVLNNEMNFEEITKKVFLDRILKKLYLTLKEFKITLEEHDKSIDHHILKKEDNIIDTKYLYFFKTRDFYNKVYHFIFNLYHQKFLEVQNFTLYKLNNNNVGY